MKIFLDSADVAEIATYIKTGFVDGVTTNPSLIAKSGRNIIETIAEICDMTDGPVSAEVAATDYDTMLAEGRKLAAIAPNVAVKVPLTEAGLMTCHALADAGTKVNVTLCFTTGQALLAAKAGAAFISPFVGRLDDLGADVVTIPPKVLGALYKHPLTDKGLDAFMADWAGTGQSIL